MFLKNLLPRWLFKDFFLDWQLTDWQNMYANQSNLLQISRAGTTIRIPQVIVFDNTNKQLGLKQIKFLLRQSKFYLDSSLETKRVFNLYRLFCWFRRRKLFNDTCLRLTSMRNCQNSKYLEESKCVLFEIQEVSYYDYVQTNLCLDAPLGHSKISLRDKLHINQGKNLEALEESKLANVLGINVLLITSDKKVILQKRSSRTIIRPGEYCPSASGTLTRADIPEYGVTYPIESLVSLFFREMVEEIGVDLDKIIRHDVSFLGLTRELVRGGQPEIFLAANIEANKQEVLQNYQKSKDRFESDFLFFLDIEPVLMAKHNYQDLESILFTKLDELINHQSDRLVSIPLWTNLSLWCKFLMNKAKSQN